MAAQRSSTDLTGRVALVTGGGAGIGAACARELAGLGAVVVVADLSAERAGEVAGTIQESGGTAFARMVDVTDAAAVDALVDDVVGQLGSLHIAVNNAGVAVPMTPVADVPDEDWRRVMSINLDGVFWCLRAELRAMRAGSGGSIVNMSSVLGTVSRAGSAAYTATKHAVIGLTKGAAIDHAADGIRVNAVGPGFIRTQLLVGRHEPAALDALAGTWPMGRLGDPEEIGRAVAWLAGDAASFVTGAYIPVDGGYLVV